MKKYALCFTMLLSLAAFLPVQGAARERRIALSEYADKVRAAWLGKMAGVGWGITTEFRYSHRLVPDSMMQAWRPEMVNEGYNQDDLYLSLLSLELLRVYGPEITSRLACLERQNLQFEYGGRNTLVTRDGIAPPDLGHPHYKPTSDGCGYTCGADYSGIAAPGLPAAPVRFAATFGSDRCYGDGLYGGVFVGAMYCEAFLRRTSTASSMRHCGRFPNRACSHRPCATSFAGTAFIPTTGSTHGSSSWTNTGGTRKITGSHGPTAVCGRVSTSIRSRWRR